MLQRHCEQILYETEISLQMMCCANIPIQRTNIE